MIIFVLFSRRDGRAKENVTKSVISTSDLVNEKKYFFFRFFNIHIKKIHFLVRVKCSFKQLYLINVFFRSFFLMADFYMEQI